MHHCLGASLTWMETEIFIKRLIARFPRARIMTPPDSLRWQANMIARQLQFLPVLLEPRKPMT